MSSFVHYPALAFLPFRLCCVGFILTFTAVMGWVLSPCQGEAVKCGSQKGRFGLLCLLSV